MKVPIPSRVVVSWVGLVVLGLATPAAAYALISDCQGLCGSSNPCTVSGSNQIEPGAVIDCSERPVIVNGTGSIKVVNGSFVLKAKSLTVFRGSAGSIKATCTEPEQQVGMSIVLQDAASGALMLYGTLGANCDSGGGFVSVEGENDIIIYDDGTEGINARGTGLDADGGQISLRSEKGSVRVYDPLDARGHTNGVTVGGNIEIDAAADIIVGEQIDAYGRQDRGGVIKLTADNNITVSSNIRAEGGLERGDGGDVRLIAGNRLVIGSGVTVSVQGGVGNNGGLAHGGTVTMYAGPGGMEINGTIDSTSGQGGSPAGAISAETDGDLTIGVGATLLGKSDSHGGDGGDISLDASASSRCSSDTGRHCETDSECPPPGACVLTSAQVAIASSAIIDASGHTAGGGAGARIDISGCSVSVGSAAMLRATGVEGGSILVTGRNALSVDASSSLTATGSEEQGTIRLLTRGTPPDTGGTTSQFSPVPAIVADPHVGFCP